TAAVTTNVEEGTAIQTRNANNEKCLNVPAEPSYEGETVTLTLCEVDPGLVFIMTGQRVIYNASGVVVGIAKNTDVSPSNVNFAFGMWMGAPAVDACDDPNATGSYGYVLLPFVQGGVFGDFSVENDAVTFTIQNASSKDGNRWGNGPYNVMLDEAGDPALLAQPLLTNDHLQLI